MSPKLRGARSRLYRRRFLQVNTRWKALAEIYTMHSFAPLSNLKIFVKNRWIFCCFFPKFRKFAQIEIWPNFAGFSPNFTIFFSGFFHNAAFFLNDLMLAAKWFNFGCQIFNFEDRIDLIFKTGFLIFNLILTERSRSNLERLDGELRVQRSLALVHAEAVLGDVFGDRVPARVAAPARGAPPTGVRLLGFDCRVLRYLREIEWI